MKFALPSCPERDRGRGRGMGILGAMGGMSPRYGGVWAADTP